MLAQLGREAALAAQSDQLARPRAGNDEPVALDDRPRECAGVLKHEAAPPTRRVPVTRSTPTKLAESS